MAEEFIDIIIREFTADGFVIYEDFETGTEITDPFLIEQVANLDGFTVLDGKAIWNDYAYQVYNPTIITTGGDKYNESHNNVITVGGGNTISDYSANINILGNNNVVNDAPLNVIVGGNNVTLYESTDIHILNALTESRVVTSSTNNVILNAIYDVGYYPAKSHLIAGGGLYWNNWSSSWNVNTNAWETYSGSEGSVRIFTDKTGSVYFGNTITQGTTEFRQGVNAYGYIKLEDRNIYALSASNGINLQLSGSELIISSTIDTGSFTTTSSFNEFSSSITASLDKKYASAYDTTSQTQTSIDSGSAMIFNTPDITNGVVIGGNRIITPTAGKYNLQFSAQIQDVGGSGHKIWIWIRKNNTDIPFSTTQITLKGGSDLEVAAWNFFIDSAVNDEWQIMWAADHLTTSLLATAPSAFYPSIPSVIVTINQL